ncbi:hypothetical protein [Vallitalea longa]|uniref:hypothetical protein n=1 Tax=Vallitalea longa TaxID=2936439 RepID=UPI0024930224|nr:hypothetical protein [Vallitalea longa]
MEQSSYNDSGAGYGVRISKSDRAKMFMHLGRMLLSILVNLETVKRSLLKILFGQRTTKYEDRRI